MSYATDGEIDPPDTDAYMELVANFYDVAPDEVTTRMLANYPDDLAMVEADRNYDRLR